MKRMYNNKGQIIPLKLEKKPHKGDNSWSKRNYGSETMVYHKYRDEYESYFKQQELKLRKQELTLQKKDKN